MAEPKGRFRRAYDELKSILFAAIAVVIIIGALFLYSGIWPPLVVVESGSMEHSTTQSSIGVIDTGDMVLVQKVSSTSSIRTYVSSYSSGYNTFGEYGDVVVYQRYGSSQYTPIIHRAIIYLEYNATSLSFDAPSLANFPDDLWSHGGVSDGQWWSMTGNLEIFHVGYKDETLVIPLDNLAKYKHNGFITKGDHNDLIDQNPQAPICREPILDSWVVGVARGELPWFGLLKLWASGQFTPYGPGVAANSWTDLFVCIFLIVAIPVSLDVVTSVMKKRGVDIWAKPKAWLERLKFWKKRS
ncbi:MAG: hypothetical protein A4E32_00647 [Methanomassiliicoccales archaeon PtaU1.Bin124]|nr:MAG: hypothetical protein A4E32_00647 [Methanomassiliicoccales archaeon PtaU1.Bin124]